MARAKRRTGPKRAAGPGKGAGASAATGDGVRGKQTGLQAKQAPAKAPPRGRPQRLAHLLPGSDRDKLRTHGPAASQDAAATRELAHPGPRLPDVATAAAGEPVARHTYCACPTPSGCRKSSK
jgi:hypothetical protein